MALDFIPREIHELARDLSSIAEFKLWTIGKSHLTLGGIFAGIVIVVVALLLSRLVQRIFRRFRDRSPQAAPSMYI
eukprot:gene31104-31699_t